MFYKGLSFLLGASLLLLATSNKGFAQSTSNAESRLQLDEIIVTSRKKEESLRDVPIAVTAITEQEIQNAGLLNILDIAKATPGLVFESYNSLPGRYESVPFVRGVVNDSNDPIRQTVSVFVDGIYVAGGTQGIGVEDVQRIEVIKGPQSAQFGRATYAGAINYITVDPGTEFKSKVAMLAATRGEYELRGSIEGSIAGSETITGRLSARYSANGGHYPNDLDAGTQLGDEETTSIGGMILFQPNDEFSLKLRGFFSNIDDNHAAVTLINSSFNSGPFGGIETIFVGTLPERTNTGLNVTGADYDAFIADARTRGVTFIGGEPDGFGLERDSYRFSLDGSYDFDSFTVSAIVGVNGDEGTALQDADFSPDRAYTIYAGREFEDLSAELRVTGSSFQDRLDWSFGVSTYQLDYNTNGAFGLQGFGQSSSFGNIGAIQLTEVTTDGIFGQIGYSVTDQFRVNLEVRYQEDEIDQKVRGMSDVSVAGAPGTFDSVLPRITFDYKPTDDSLLYLSYSEGNLAGGFNGAFLGLSAAQQAEAQLQFPVEGTFDEETLENIEFGWKQQFDKGNIGVALYRMERTDQVSTAVTRTTNPDFATDPTAPPVVTTTVRVNTAATEITGLEIEGNWFPTDNWSMRGTIAYTDAKISAFPASGDSGDFEDVFGTDEGFIGRKAERYPPYQLTLSATYDSASPLNFFGTQSDWYVRGDLFYADKFYLSTPNLGEAPAVSDVNLRAGIRNERYSLEAFITNLLEETAPTTGNNGSDLSNNTPLFIFGVEATNIGLRDKRQFGIRANFNF